jgi:hypothetical protein
MDGARKRRVAILAGVVLLLSKRRRTIQGRRRLWTHEWLKKRDELGFYSNLIELKETDEVRYANFLRMDHDTFDILLSLVEEKIARKNTNMRSCISPGERLTITIRFLATGDSFRSLQIDVTHLFDPKPWICFPILSTSRFYCGTLCKWSCTEKYAVQTVQ